MQMNVKIVSGQLKEITNAINKKKMLAKTNFMDDMRGKRRLFGREFTQEELDNKWTVGIKHGSEGNKFISEYREYTTQHTACSVLLEELHMRQCACGDDVVTASSFMEDMYYRAISSYGRELKLVTYSKKYGYQFTSKRKSRTKGDKNNG